MNRLIGEWGKVFFKKAKGLSAFFFRLRTQYDDTIYHSGVGGRAGRSHNATLSLSLRMLQFELH